MVRSLNDAHRMGDNGVGAGGAQVVGGKAFQNFVCQTVGSGQGQFQRLSIRDACAVEIGRFEPTFVGQGLDLGRSTMYQHDTNIERAQNRHVQQDVGEIFIGDDRPIHAEDEGLFAELWNVL